MDDAQAINVIKRPKAVVFDTDNTLYPYDVAHHTAMETVRSKTMTLLSISRQDFDKAFDNARTDVKKKLKDTASSHSRLLYFQRTLEYLGLGTKILLTLDLEQTYWRTFLVNTRLFPGVKEFIYQLKSDSIITANVTDLTAQIQFRKMVYLGMDEYFDYVVTSEEAGKDKPDQAAFGIILSKIGVNPSEIWMIGDNPINDIKGAILAGMTPFQKIHDGVKVSELLKGLNGHVFKDYYELLNLYRTLS